MITITSLQKKLIENEICAFATCSGKKPNVIAITSQKVVGKNKILITDNFFNKTKKNLLKNKNAALAVWDKKRENAFQFKGTVRYLTSGKWKKAVDKDLNNKGYAHKAAALFTISEIWDLANPKLLGKT